jgi:hypothetical protein
MMLNFQVSGALLTRIVAVARTNDVHLLGAGCYSGIPPASTGFSPSVVCTRCGGTVGLVPPLFSERGRF